MIGCSLDCNNNNRGVEEKQKGNEKKISSNGSFVSIDEKGIRKKRSQERMGRRGLRTGNKGGGENEHEFGGNELSSHDALEVKTDKKDSAKKKQGVVSFLKRMKQNSPKEAKEEINASEDDSEEDSKTEKEEDKKRRGRKIVASDGRRERITRNSTRGRVTREEGRKAAKRGVGRPPKRPEKAAPSGKRGRDNVEAEVGVGGRPKKRSRR